MNRTTLFLLILGLLSSACSDVTISQRPEVEGDEPGECYDGADNDFDGFFDCDDEDCAEAPDCIPNSAPGSAILTIEPPAPTTVEDITCVITQGAEDADGDELTYTYAWFLGGEDVGESSPTIAAEATSRGQNWTCEVTANDERADGPSASAAVTIVNSPPTQPTVEVIPNFPAVENPLECVINDDSNDVDGDEISYAMNWELNGGFSSWNGPHIPAEATSPNDVWACVVTPNDGIEDGPDGSFEVEVHVDVVPHISAGGAHNCRIGFDGSYVCWGASTGEVDFGQTAFQGEAFTIVRAGEFHSCGLNFSGAASCWGRNDHDQSESTPGTFLALDAGPNANCAAGIAGGLDCWGSANFWNEQPPTGSFHTVGVGGDFACAIDTDNDVHCWGEEPAGLPSQKLTDLSVGTNHVCGLDENGFVLCWGDDSHGEVSGAPAGAGHSAITAGDRHSCALDSSGLATCWGDDGFGQATAAGGFFDSISAGWDHTCGQRSDGIVACWGDNSHGQTTQP